MGSQLLPLKGAQPPQFSVHVYCGQTTGWMKPPLGTKVDLGPGYIVLDRNPAPPEKGAQQPPLFSTHVYCGHGRPSQLLLSSCNVSLHLTTWTFIFSASGLPSDDKMNRMEKLLEMTTWRKWMLDHWDNGFLWFCTECISDVKTGFFYYRLAETSFLPVIERLHHLMTRWVKVINVPATPAMLALGMWTLHWPHCTHRLHQPTVRSFIHDHEKSDEIDRILLRFLKCIEAIALSHCMNSLR